MTVIVDFTQTMTPAQIANLMRYDTLRNRWVQEHRTFEGFEEWYQQNVERRPE